MVRESALAGSACLLAAALGLGVPVAASESMTAGRATSAGSTQIAQGSGGELVAHAWRVISNVRQRTKTKQVQGGENLNVMEWTTQDGPNASMSGGVVYFKKFKSAFKYFNERFGEFTSDLPDEWEDFGIYQEQVKAFSGNNIGIANQYITDIFEWFKSKQRMIGNQGGIIFVYGANGAMVAYQDQNRYKSNNVAGILTGRSFLKKIQLSDDPLPMKPGFDRFIQAVIEDPEGIIKIDVPYVLFDVR